MSLCVPIKDLRDTAAFDEMVSTSPTPVIVTKNGYDRFVSADGSKRKPAPACSSASWSPSASVPRARASTPSRRCSP